MNFVDRIADAQDIPDVFELVNEFLSGLHPARDIYKLPSHVRPEAKHLIDPPEAAVIREKPSGIYCIAAVNSKFGVTGGATHVIDAIHSLFI